MLVIIIFATSELRFVLLTHFQNSAEHLTQSLVNTNQVLHQRAIPPGDDLFLIHELKCYGLLAGKDISTIEEQIRDVGRSQKEEACGGVGRYKYI